MATGRKTISKRIRFEIFTRDGYRCQYCGAQPPDVVLEIDHRVPVAEGGDNDPMNLLTACNACNNGKRAKLPGEFTPTPDAIARKAKLDQEAAEYASFLESQAAHQAVEERLIKEIQEHWLRISEGHYFPHAGNIRGWIARFDAMTVVTAISKAAGAFSQGKISASTIYHCGKAAAYVTAIMYRIEEDNCNGAN